MAGDFIITTQVDPDTSRIACSGPVDRYGCDKLEDALAVCFRGRPNRIVVDLADAQVTRGCARLLMHAAAECARDGVGFALRLNGRQRRALGLVAVDAVVVVEPTGSDDMRRTSLAPAPGVA